jgi:beta-galactosidase/beta-glucuronidase
MEGFNKLITPYAEKMDKTIPWNEYPRPSMVRDSFLCLNGEWDFALSSDESVSSYQEKILVPFPPESALSGIERQPKAGEYLHYRRTFILPENMVGKRVILHFGAVDTIATVFLNGEKIAYHEGGYLPFDVEITGLVHTGENTLRLLVKDELDISFGYGKQTKKRGGMWYTPISGIWQSVWLEAVPESYIESLKITTNMRGVEITVKGGDTKKKITLKSGEIFEFDGDSTHFSPKEIHHWSPEYPYLYSFTLESGEDKIESYFALREIKSEVVNGIPRLTLNGSPYLFNGLLDQGYYPDGIFLPATSDGYREDIKRAKSCGFNMLRKHIKVEPEIFYHLCDRLGMVVFQDMVNNSNYNFLYDTALPTIGFKRLPDRRRTKREREIFESQMYGTLDHLHFFPSILYYTIFNEGWGQFDADKMFDKAKAYDPTRIFDATSGWFYRKRSDVDSRHVYFKPVKLGRPSDRPIVISEFGGYSHRVEGHIYGIDEYGYSSFATREEFEEAFTRLYREELKPLIKGGICGLVYTQISDVEDETNGLLTYDRAICKLDSERCFKLMEELYNEIK